MRRDFILVSANQNCQPFIRSLYIVVLFKIIYKTVMRDSRSKGWQTMVNAKAKQQNLLKMSRLTPSRDTQRLQRFTPSKYQGKSMKIFASISRSPSNSVKHSQSRVQSNCISSQVQHDDYQIKSNSNLPSQIYLQSSKRLSHQIQTVKILLSNPRNQSQINNHYQQQGKKESVQYKFDEEFFKSIKPIEEKSYNYDILKTLQQEFQQFKKWVFSQLRKQQEMVIQLANQITKTLQQQSGKNKRGVIKRYNNNFRQIFIDEQIRMQEQFSKESKLWESNLNRNEYQLSTQQTGNPIKRQIVNIQNGFSTQRSNLRPKSISHLNFKYDRSSRAISPSPRVNIQFNKFFETMSKIKNQINELQLVAEKHEQSVTDESRNIQK